MEIILLVDYDREFIRKTKALLESKGYKVKTALNGKKAIEKVLSEDSPIVLLNLKVPDFPGRELLKRIKKIDKNIAVIITDHESDLGPVEFMKLGVLESFSKPIDSLELLKAVENAGRILNLKMDGELEQDSLLNKFFPFFAHEIRNPLQAIGGALTIIERRSDLNDHLLDQSITVIKEEVQHLTDFVHECLDFIRPPLKIQWGEVNINETIKLIVNLMTFMFKELSDKIQISTHFDPNLSIIYANYEEIKKVLINILKNGFESMIKRPSGVLSITTMNTNYNNFNGVEIIVRDTGMGILKEDLNNIGTPFFTTKLRGTGLGLAICQRIIVERHNGKLLIESEEDKGTTVTIKLPVSPGTESSGV